MEKQPAKLNYFFDQGFKELKATIKDFWVFNSNSALNNFEKASFYYWRSWAAFKKIFFYAAGITMYVFGFFWFLTLSLIHITILFIVYLIVYFLFTFTWVLDYLYRVKEKIFAACPNPDCYEKSSLPIYHCPKCGVAHTQLWPSKYGIWTRTCTGPPKSGAQGDDQGSHTCGAKLPCTFFNGRGKLRATCPKCKNEMKTEEGTPLIIPIVGPPFAGKSTYLYSMIDNLMDEFTKKGYKIHSNISQRQIDDSIQRLTHGGLTKTVEMDTKAVDLIISKGGTKYAVYFYDVAGEAFNASRSLEGHKFYGYYSAMIFLLDPFAVEQIRNEYYEQFNKYLSNSPQANTGAYDNALGLNEVLAVLKLNLAKNYHIDEATMVKQNLAVLIPKTDYFTDDLLETDKDCRNFLNKFGQKAFIDNIDYKFKNVHYFNVVSKGKKSKGVLKPIEWILNQEMKKTRMRRFLGNLLMTFFVFAVVGALALGGYFAYNTASNFISNVKTRPKTTETTVTKPAALQPNYYCDAGTSLNVREQPNTTARVIGQLKRNEEIHVYSIDNATKFAKINYNGKTAYVSADYLKPKNTGSATSKPQSAKEKQAAAEKGDALAQLNLGYDYYYGNGVTKDYTKAAYWYRKSAEQGNAQAQSNLAHLYYNGQGVTRDYKQTKYWFQKAADQGDARGQTSLGHLYWSGHGVTQDYKQAVYWHQKSAEQNYALAQSNLGYCYEHGNGVEQDKNMALFWYEKAKGNEDGSMSEQNKKTLADQIKALTQEGYSSSKANVNSGIEQSINITSSMTAAIKNGVLTITSSKVSEAMPDFDIHDNVPPWGPNVISVVISDKISSIGSGAFMDCVNLTSITIPNSIKAIGSEAFMSCSKLTSLTIPGSVTTIGSNAFYGCGFTSVTIPNSVTKIGENAFNLCFNLKEVTISWARPLSVPDNLFNDVNLSDVKLYVPSGTKTLYQTAGVWKNFKEIIEL